MDYISLFNKSENFKLIELRFPTNKYLSFSIRNGFLYCNIPFKNNVQIIMKEDSFYSFTIFYLETIIQIHINDNFYDISQGIEITKFIIIGDKFLIFL